MPYVLNTLTANLVVADVERSIAFYRDVLGFELTATVPDASPYVFASLRHGSVEVFVNSRDAAVAEYPMFGDRPIGGTLTLFIGVSDITSAYQALEDRVKIVMPFEKKWYGVTEFAFEDPDGYVITFAQSDATHS